MPSGYTYDVQTGKISTLEDFAKSCARAFIWQARDSNEQDLRKLVSEKGYDLSHYENDLAETNSQLEVYLNMTDMGWDELVERENKEALSRYEESVKRMKEQELRYRTMLEKVKAWEPPTDKHIEMKRFMITQLEDSIKFDCYEMRPPKININSQEFRDGRIKEVRRAIEQIEVQIDKMKNNKNLGAEWVEQLLGSIEGK
jgi:hypothetical protein